MHPFFKALPVLLVLALPATALADERVNPGVIDIQGVGEVAAAPDMAFVSSGVTTQADTAREALNANTAAMAELIKVLEDAGIEAKDIQTSNFSVQPQYVYSDKRNENGYTSPPKIAGYQVSNAVTVRVRKLDTLGAVLDKAVTVGANTIDGIRFSVSDTDALYEKARKDAIADAKAKAELYTEAAGVGLGRILQISENNGFAPQPMMMREKAMMASDAAPVPMQGGEVNYNVSVSVRWELDQ